VGECIDFTSPLHFATILQIPSGKKKEIRARKSAEELDDLQKMPQKNEGTRPASLHAAKMKPIPDSRIPNQVVKIFRASVWAFFCPPFFSFPSLFTILLIFFS
jgi:hypothetical protein